MIVKAWLKGTGAIALGLAVTAPQALAEDEYFASTGQVLSMEIRTAPEMESDALIDATCLAANTIDIRFGGEYKYAKSKGKPASLTLASGKLTAKLAGVAVDSPDDEMTGGLMLLTAVEPHDTTMQILSSGKEILFKLPGGATEKVTLGQTVTEAVKKFDKDCADGDKQ